MAKPKTKPGQDSFPQIFGLDFPVFLAIVAIVFSVLAPIFSKLWEQYKKLTRIPGPFKEEVKKRFPTPNTAEEFAKIQDFLRKYTVDRMLDELQEDGFFDDNWSLQKCIFSKIISGKIPQPEFQQKDQRSLGNDFSERYMVAANDPQLDEHWNDDSDEWRGKASMGKRHRFLLMKSPKGKDPAWFNCVVFGLKGKPQKAVEVLCDMKAAALKMTQACGWSKNIGLFFVVYGHTTCTSPLHIVDLDCTGPSYEAMKYKLIKLEDVLSCMKKMKK